MNNFIIKIFVNVHNIASILKRVNNTMHIIQLLFSSLRIVSIIINKLYLQVLDFKSKIILFTNKINRYNII